MGACKWCGAENAENAATCANCGQSIGAGEEASAFDPEAFSNAMSAKVDEQIAARMAEAGPSPAAAVPPTPEPPSPPVTPAPVAAPQTPVTVAPVPMAPPQYAPPPQPPAYAQSQQYPPPQQYAAPPQQYAAPPQQYPPPQQYAPPQQYGYAQPLMQPPKSGLANAIITTILCCWPLGGVAIYFAIQVDKRWAAGDFQGARDAAKKANLFATIGAVIGLLISCVYVIAMFASEGGSTYSY